MSKLEKTPNDSPVIYVVDDQPDELFLIKRVARTLNVPVKDFDSPQTFLGTLPARPRGCVVVDLMMPQMSGLDLFAALRMRQNSMPVVVMTGFADVGTCRRALLDGVFDFVEKSWNPFDLVEVIQRALQWDQDQFKHHHRSADARSKLEAISPRETEVMNLLSKGATLKDVAREFNISVQTASKHRKSLFGKLSVNNEVELLNMLMEANVSRGEPSKDIA